MLGLLLPVGDEQHFEGQDRCVSTAIDAGFDSIWLRDLPAGERADRDRGTALDPFVYATYLSQTVPAQVDLGFAVVGAGFWHPLVAARSIASLLHLAPQRLHVGIGAGDKPHVNEVFGVRPGKRHELVRRFVEELLDALGPQALLDPDLAFLRPPGCEAPQILLASTNEQLWSEVGKRARGLMTWFERPARFEELVRMASAYADLTDVSMTLNMEVDTRVPDAVPVLIEGFRPCTLKVGSDHLVATLKAYVRRGLTTLIVHFPQPDRLGTQVVHLARAWHEAQEIG